MTVTDPSWFRSLPGWEAKRHARRVHRIHDDRYNLMVEAANYVAVTSGVVALEDGGTLSGVYQSNVACAGDVEITGNVEIYGNLTVLGNLTNEGGHELIVRGDLHATSLYFTKSDTSSPQQDIRVDGDMIFTYLDFPQCGGSSATLRVGGDLIGANGWSGTNIYGYGSTPGTPGLNVVVYGDACFSVLEANGADGDGNEGGAGGDVYIFGDLNLLNGYIDLFGGDATDYDAGSGGDLEVSGSISAGSSGIDLSGGDADNGNAGNGGYFWCEGDVVLDDLYCDGGDCGSDSEEHRSGNAGLMGIEGFTSCRHLYARGGDRYGTLSTGGSNTNPYGGQLFLNAGGIFRTIHLHGGYTQTYDYSPHDAGSGGAIWCEGPLSVYWSIYIYGEDADGAGNAGDGGMIQVRGDLSVGNNLSSYGGYANSGNGGDGGSVYVGETYGTDVSSNARLSSIYLSGGDADAGNAGYGGYLSVGGTLSIWNYTDMRGGYCYSSDSSHNSGTGGAIWCRSINSIDTSIYLSAGERYGTFSVNAPGSQVGGGYLEVYGDAVLGYVEASGSYNGTSGYSSVPGGNGGYIRVDGSLTMNDRFDSYGGRAIGTNGGKGGWITVNGSAKIDEIYLNGGGSYGDEDPPAVNGGAGEATFNGGIICNYFEAYDGNGAGTSSSDNSYLYLQGGCFFYTLHKAARSDSQIRSNTAPAFLKIHNLGTKDTLNADNGDETGSISGLLADSMFMAGGGTWYAVTGSLISV